MTVADGSSLKKPKAFWVTVGLTLGVTLFSALLYLPLKPPLLERNSFHPSELGASDAA